jgi:hydroxymethylpyrimidine/phosphomethylpyrimidine kinase
VHDQLFAPDGTRVAALSEPRLETHDTHGTGCTFASALATGLGAGQPITASFERAVRFVRAALHHAPHLGEGHGPIGHALGVVPFDAIQR